MRERLGLGDNLPRGTRQYSKEQYAKAMELLRSDRYVTIQEVAESCGVSYSGLEQHLLFYHKDLVKRRIKIREKAVRRQRKGEITGRGTVHVPSPKAVKKYAEAVYLYSTTSMSASQIAKQTGVSKKTTDTCIVGAWIWYVSERIFPMKRAGLSNDLKSGSIIPLQRRNTPTPYIFTAQQPKALNHLPSGSV